MWYISCFGRLHDVYEYIGDLMKKFMSFEKQKFFSCTKFMRSPKCNICKQKLFSCTQIIIITLIILGVFTLVNILCTMLNLLSRTTVQMNFTYFILIFYIMKLLFYCWLNLNVKLFLRAWEFVRKLSSQYI